METNTSKNDKAHDWPWIAVGLAIGFALITVVLLWMLSARPGVAAGEEWGRTPPASPHARNTRVPCHSPATWATCTPTLTALATSTSMPTATAPPTSAPTDTTTVTAAPTSTHTATATASSSSTRTPTRTATSTPTAPPTGTPAATPTPDYRFPPADILAAEAELARLINEHRASLGYRQWTLRADLSRAQRKWAIQMIVNNQCYHGDFGARAFDEGYTGFPWGECGSCGYASAADALQGWLDSPAHRGIVEEHPNMTEMGVGGWRYPNGYWQFWLLVGVGGASGDDTERKPRPAPVEPIRGSGHTEGRP